MYESPLRLFLQSYTMWAAPGQTTPTLGHWFFPKVAASSQHTPVLFSSFSRLAAINFSETYTDLPHKNLGLEDNFGDIPLSS